MGICDYLDSLEFTGLARRNLESVIKNNDDLIDFQLFVLDNEEMYSSRLELAHMYIAYTRRSESIMDEESFISRYNSSFLPKDRTLVLQELYLAYVDEQTADKIHRSLSKDGLTLSFWYHSLLKYRDRYNSFQAVDLSLISI